MNYPNLRAEMARTGVSTARLAESTGLSIATAYRRINEGTFSFEEAERIRSELFPECTVDYLFDGGEGA